MVIYVDSREPISIAEGLRKRGNEVEVKTLEAGDIVFGDHIIERKTVKDFYSGIIKRTIWAQVKGLAGQKRPLLVVVGESLSIIYVGKRKPIIVQGKVLGAMVSIYEAFKVPVTYFPTEALFLDWVTLLYDKSERKEPSIRPVEKLRAASDQEVKENMLCQVPKVGPITAKKILETYGSIVAIPVEGKEVPGVNPEVLKRVKELLSK